MIFGGGRKGLEETLDEIEAVLDGGDRARAVELARKAVKRFPESSDALGLLGEALEGVMDLEGAIKAYRAALVIDPGWAAALARIASIEIEAGEIAAAREHAARAALLDAGDADTCWVRGILADLDGRPREARDRYRDAARRDPDRYHVPARVSMDEFHGMASAAVDDLPEKVRAFLGDVPVVIEDMPASDADGRFAAVSPLILGECIGSHLSSAGAVDAATGTPSRIVLYKLNLERECETVADLEEEVRITVLHEVLHWLGLDEDEVADRGLD